MYTEDCYLFKFSLGSFRAFPIFADLDHVVSRKWLTVEGKDQNLGLMGKYHVYIQSL